MKYQYYIMALALVASSAMAQETYENAPLAQENLNGTARYVGMGGAMDALGADLSTIGANPAGIGLFRGSTVSTSFGVVSQADVKGFSLGNKTHASFDQIGFVYSMRSDGGSFLNVAFNYHKGRDFHQILNAADRFSPYTVGGKSTYLSSQNKSVYQKVVNGVFTKTSDQTYSYLDDLYMRKVVESTDGSGNKVNVYYPASDYIFNRYNSGYIGHYDFNVSGNINDRVYLGFTFGLKDVHYRSYSEYTEHMVTNVDGLNSLGLISEKTITGTGFDLKAGVIFRPVESSPFRLGLSIATPTWYDLSTKGSILLSYQMDPSSHYNSGSAKNTLKDYDFKFNTPWKFELSVGHTIGKTLALGASYEYADYSSNDIRINDGYDYDGWSFYEVSSRDAQMKKNIESVLKGVSTFKAGVELKPLPELALRVGYNYVSPMYQQAGMKNIVDGSYIASPGHALTTSTDYTNWDATDRFTGGLGYKLGRVNLDLAYQYSQTKGTFHPFNTLTTGNITTPGDTALEGDNIENPVKVHNKRHQILFTVGYRF